MTILVDTDALIALFDINDALHSKAVALLVKLHTKKAELILLPTTLSEFALVSTNRIGLKQTKVVLESWVNGVSNKVSGIDQDLIKSAVKLFHRQTSKEESLFDCFVMAAVSKYKYDAIFSFDKGYKKAKNNNLNLKLASDL